MDASWADRISGYEDLEPVARAIGARLYRPTTFALRSERDMAALLAEDIDALIVFGWQRLIPDWLINHVSRGAWGVHGGPEKPPRCRGRAVLNWALVLGCERFFMYLFRIGPGVDDGDIVDLREFEITPDDDILTLYHKNCVVSTAMVIANLPAILDGTVAGVPQPAEGATYLPRRDPEDGGIAWTQPARRIADLIRAVASPYPGAFTRYEGATVTIQRAQVFDRTLAFDGRPGEILEVFPNGDFLVNAADAAIYVRSWSSDAPVDLRVGGRFAPVSGRQPPDPPF